MMKTLLALLMLLPLTVNAGWIEDTIAEFALGDIAVTEYKQPENGDVWGIVYGGVLKPGFCKYLDYKNVVPCLTTFTGVSRVLDLQAAYPQCVLDIKDIPESVRVRCVELNPFKVASSIFGSRSLYAIDPIIAWRDGGKVGTIPMQKIGSIATQLPCEPRIVVMVGKDIVGIATNADGVRGATRCE